MLRMIAGLDVPSAGHVAIFGEEMVDTPPNKRPVNTVFQQYALFPHLDVDANVGFGLRMQKVAKSERASRVADALSLVRLGGLGGRRPTQLSGGQQQRVALARALVNRPKVLLLDEPLGALDLQLRQEMQTELKALQRELGITFVFVTHDQEEALAMSDRIAVMDAGRVLQIGTPHEIYERPNDRFVASFIGRTNLLEGKVARPDSVVLETGAALKVDATGLVRGTAVTVAARPERLRIRELDDSTPHGGLPSATTGTSLTGVVTDVTYLGNAVVTTVTVDWMRLEIRGDSDEASRIEVGRDVEVTWADDALRLLADPADPADAVHPTDPGGDAA
jgi:spermidine/putrescine transport system ATP-binding protein